MNGEAAIRWERREYRGKRRQGFETTLPIAQIHIHAVAGRAEHWRWSDIRVSGHDDEIGVAITIHIGRNELERAAGGEEDGFVESPVAVAQQDRNTGQGSNRDIRNPILVEIRHSHALVHRAAPVGNGDSNRGRKGAIAGSEKDADATLTLACDDIEFAIAVDVGGDQGAWTIGIRADALKSGSSGKSTFTIAGHEPQRALIHSDDQTRVPVRIKIALGYIASGVDDSVYVRVKPVFEFAMTVAAQHGDLGTARSNDYKIGERIAVRVHRLEESAGAKAGGRDLVIPGGPKVRRGSFRGHTADQCPEEYAHHRECSRHLIFPNGRHAPSPYVCECATKRCLRARRSRRAGTPQVRAPPGFHR